MLAPMGLRLSEEKTRVVPHRRGVRLPGVAHSTPAAGEVGTGKMAGGLHHPSKKALCLCDGQGAIADNSRAKHRTLAGGPAALGLIRCCGDGCNYFRHGVSSRDVQLTVDHFSFSGGSWAGCTQTTRWRLKKGDPCPPFLPTLGRGRDGKVEMFRPTNGADCSGIATGHSNSLAMDEHTQRPDHVESRMR